MLKRTLLLFAISSARFGSAWGQSVDAPPYTWKGTGPLQIARHSACVTALPDGRILVTGGQDDVGPLRTVEVYQSDGSFSLVRDMLRARAGHTCTTLSDGRVLVAGGGNDGPAVQAEVYDPAADSWTETGPGTERRNHTATLLPDGRVLLAGGETADGISPLLEWYNPLSNQIRPLPNMLSTARSLHAAAPLADGSVLVTGGWDGQSLLDSADIVKLDGTVASTPALPGARAGHTATALDTGCVFVAGGLGTEGELRSTALYCPDTAAFRAGPDMAVERFGHVAVRLPGNGNVLIAGGFSQGEATGTSELYDAGANALVRAGSLTLARLGIAAAADPVSGAVLAVGGFTGNGPVAACGILRAPNVTFGKARYLDGDVISVSGLGWTPGETVKITYSVQSFAQPGQLAQIAIKSFQTTASALGRIELTLSNATVGSAGFTFRASAAGEKSGLTAGGSAVQLSRTNTTLNIIPFPALTRQPVTLQALVQPVTRLNALDGGVTFTLGTSLLGSVSTTGQVTSVSGPTITDGTSNTIQFGETTLPTTSTGTGSTVTFGDGSVRNISPGSAFQIVTRDIPSGSTMLSLSGSPGSVTAAYSPIAGLYAGSSATATVSVQKRTVDLSVGQQTFSVTPIKVGDPVAVPVLVSPPQRPFADVNPSGKVHLTLPTGIVLDASVTPVASLPASLAQFLVTLPAGTHTFSALYDGDDVFLQRSVLNAGPVTVAKGVPGFALIPGKSSYTVGEPITILGRIQHPRVTGATPTGAITRSAGPTQFQGAAVGGDPGNTGIIDTKLPVTGFVTAGSYSITMKYGGDANFQPVSAGTILTIAKAVPQISVIPPAQAVAGQPASFVVRMSGPAGATQAPAVTGQVSLTGGTSTVQGNLVSGTVILRTTFPAAGTFTITANYGGDANYVAASSGPIQVVVQ